MYEAAAGSTLVITWSIGPVWTLHYQKMLIIGCPHDWLLTTSLLCWTTHRYHPEYSP